VELASGEFHVVLMGLIKRNWIKLAQPLAKYDPEIVYDFYANAWGRSKNARAKIKGARPMDPL